ncbi:endoplasmic reticulum membrane protein [Tubulinosema ratisbonensis]|uniref:Derlin n=1 Tax=Tubulinosema ratisbonensis TaxID=291195 RepID=A0A437ANZ5_9MICR|nr:endoplasmic reticulum membrane protein [Tubulinosema ratisbonensis]
MQENPFLSLITNTPFVTKILVSLILLTSLSLYLEIVSSYQLMLTFNINQCYRLITSLLYFGQLNFDTILHIIFMFRYSKMLEESYVYTSDYLYFLICVIFMIYLCAFVFNIVILGPILSSVITYVWTRKNPYAQLQLFGFIIFPAFYLPFVIPLFSYLSERRILKGEIVGIFIGHVYYFFKFVFPTFGVDIFKTPVFLKKMFGEYVNEEKRDIVNEESLIEEEKNSENELLDDKNDINIEEETRNEENNLKSKEEKIRNISEKEEPRRRNSY